MIKKIFTSVAFEEDVRTEKGKPIPQEHPYWTCHPPGKIDYHSYGYISWSKDWESYRFEPNDNISLPLNTMKEIAEFMEQL